MHILLIEDDHETAAYVGKGLREENHLVDVARTGRDGLHLALEGKFDLLIVDRMLPEMDGLTVVRAARAAGVSAPVLFLTAMGAVADRVDGLEAGGDDYLIKPFSFAELRARVSALGRRPHLHEQTTRLTVGDLKLDRLQRTVHRGVTEIDLQPREFQLLEFLMLNVDRVVTRTMLLESVWEFHFDPGTNIVESHISRLRSKIDRDDGSSLIRTIRGAGYSLRAP